MRHWRYAILACLLLSWLSATSVRADGYDDVAVWRGVWHGEELSVVVLARGHQIPDDVLRSEPWWRWGNTATDAYLFFWSDDQMVDLVLDFTMVNGRPVARVFAPQTSQARVAIWSDDLQFSLPEELLPVVTVWPRDGEWLIGGLPNFNLEGHELDLGSGMNDWHFEVGGEKPGAPDWITRAIVSSSDPSTGFPHFTAAQRMDPSVPYELADPLMPSWPYLSVIQKEGHWGKVQPLFFDLRARMVTTNWTGFHIAGMYQINSLAYPPDVNFEAPFAFYRFDEDAGAYANLVIRSDVWPANDPSGPPPYHEQRSAIRMTWTGTEPQLWRYSLTVNGDHAPTDDVTIGDAVFQAVPYAAFPSWVTSKDWKAVTFVEAVDGETGSEGIYDYSVEDNYPVTGWVNGLSSESPVEAAADAVQRASDVGVTDQGSTHTPFEDQGSFQTPFLEYPAIHPLRLGEGFRGEYSLTYQQVPRLYLSPIDNRVHLVYADAGIWNLGDGQVLRVRNLDGDAFIDSWSRERVPLEDARLRDDVVLAVPGEVEEELYLLGDYLLQATQGEVNVLHLAEPLSQQDVAIPTDQESWEGFVADVDREHVPERDPHDLRGWLDAFAGDALQLKGVTLSDVRATDDGFRFVLTVRSGWTSTGLDLLGLGSLQPGAYLVTYNGAYQVTPLTPATPTVMLFADGATQLTSSELRVRLSNGGLEDVAGATLEVRVTQAGQTPVLVIKRTLDLLGETSVQVPIEWAPPTDGLWHAMARIRLPDGRHVDAIPVSVTVTPAETVNARTLVTSTSSIVGVATAVIVLFSCALATGLYGWRFANVSSIQQADHGD